ncbi:MAG TPA: efflux transporter outer membrane subunit [Caldimonas sp.]|nr:efflux transporter outer membrane subunit [Caldimonas sp.]
MRLRRFLPASVTARLVLAALALSALGACTVGTPYVRPDAPTPPAYKEAAGWVPAEPADALERGAWWTLFGDAELDRLESKVEVSNQNVAAAVANYAQARALVRVDQAALFPTLGATAGASRSGGGGGSGGVSRSGNSLQAGLDASWAPDVWGRLRLAVSGAEASAQASEADLAAATLSAQALLATDYFALREADAEEALLRRTVAGYERAVTITQNSYDAGISAKTDLLQAQTTLENARATLVGLTHQRAQLEHAIAVLVGLPPADFRIDVAPWVMNVPTVPPGVPSTLLQRRPDIAAAERAVAAANAQIGIQRSAYFPSLSLSGSFGFASSTASRLFSAPSSLWSVGLSVAQTIFDAGATRARVEGAEAARDAAVAQYRQTVLAAFQNVEDQLSASRTLEAQEGSRRRASAAADLVEQQLLNQYRAGQVGYTSVVTAQASALSARQTLVQLVSSRQASAVALIQALGGGWHVPQAFEGAASTPQ